MRVNEFEVCDYQALLKRPHQLDDMFIRWLSVIVALLAYYVWNLRHAIQAQLVRKKLPPLFSAGGKCELIQERLESNEFKFCEDGLVLAPGVAIFSCDPGRRDLNTAVGPMLEPGRRGSLWALHYTSTTTEKPYPLELINFPTNADFRPLGIDVTTTGSAGTPSRLLVTNRRHRNPTIEVFRIYLELNIVKLTHEITLTDPSFVSPNAIAAVSPNAFFLSHDHRFTNRMTWPLDTILPWLETFLSLPLSRVDLVFFETLPGTGVRNVRTVAPNIACANGIALSADGSTLAVASTSRAKVLFYSKCKEDIKYVSSVRVPFSVDNLAFAGDQLLAAGYPYIPDFMALADGKSSRAPSYVTAITPRLRGSTDHEESWLARITAGANVTTVFTSDGSFLTSSSGAFVDLEMKTMFVVALYGAGVSKCNHHV
ncbi:hypothetical protein RSOLAG22IIIB_05404 [Rhizoctonia solani]|uniref:Arylesterase n=1 Tax=Rhizoctonia solani TaxID=456999 RepID=A0A0K6G6Y6_9AGAM|nr:hypothetical protein RSOLAG22IIIB_05404 [Rhizoctonia solani]